MAGDDLKNSANTNINTKPSAVKVFNCSSCGGGVVLRAVGQSITAVCGSCRSVIDSSNENYQIIGKVSKAGKRDQVISLGQRGKLHGVLWEVIGYMERCDGTAVYSWSEYLLFNPLKGFRWLTEFDGHWNYILITKSQPEVNPHYYGRKVAKYLNKNYFLFHKGLAKVSFVVGEFYWQVKQDETVEVEDYISPPEILSCEKNNNEVVWSLGEYIQPEAVRSAFQITGTMPLQSSVAPNQPSTVSQAANYAGKYWVLFLGILVIIQLIIMSISKNEVVYSGRFFYSSIDIDKLKVSPSFELKHGVSNLEVVISAPLRNNWMEIQSDLVNDNNGETQDFEQGIEFYSGTDHDGNWSEGSQTNSLILSSVPEGKYHLNIEASGPALPAIVANGFDDVVTPPSAVNKTEYWQNGKIKYIEPIVNGKIEGLAKYYFENGQLHFQIPYKNGEKHGSYKIFKEDGSLEQTGTNIYGKLSGNVRWYDLNGNVTRNVYYNEGLQLPTQAINNSDNLPLDVTVRRDVITWSNFLWALLLISIYPLFILWRNRSFEIDRWSQSDFSPYYQNNGDE